jgi:PAS domain S-box-containing protein
LYRPVRINGPAILHSIPAKICLSILVIETALLSLMGYMYTANFNREIEANVLEKMRLPAVLMSLRALSFNAVSNTRAISDLIGEEVVEAFISRNDGTVYYTSNVKNEGKHYSSLLAPGEKLSSDGVAGAARFASFKDFEGNFFKSIFAPLIVGNRPLGHLYVRISANHVEEKKQAILWLFLGGSSITIILTTLLEAFFLYRMFVPRVRRSIQILTKVGDGDFSAHVIPPGPPDQLGTLIQQINGMIKTVSLHTETLVSINAAGEQLGLAQSYRQLGEIASALLSKYFDVELDRQYPVTRSEMSGTDILQPLARPVSYTRDKKQLYLTLPENTEHKLFVQARFTRPDGSPVILEKEKFALLRSLNRLINSSIRRVSAVESISVAEAKYRKLFSSTVDGIFRSNPDGRIEEANPALARMLGFDSPMDLMSDRTDLATQGYADPGQREVFLEIINSQGYILDWEVEYRRKDGSIFPASISGQTVKDAEGRIVAYEGRISDITDRKLREQANRERDLAEAASKAQAQIVTELQQHRQQLQRSLGEKEILLREVLHRTKNNMLVIISILRLQMPSIQDPGVRAIFTDTENRIRAMALVHERLYKSENLSEINLGDYLEDMARTLIETMVMDRRISLTVTSQPVCISIDYAVPLGLAVNEIITNAVRHGFPDDRWGNISLALDQDDDKLISLVIKDDGTGLPADFSPEKLSNFGMQMVHNLITRQLLGSYSIRSDNGTLVRIDFKEPVRPRRV